MYEVGRLRKGAKMLLWSIVVTLAMVTAIQWFGSISRQEAKADPLRMLYEVSLLQAELLAGFVGEAARAEMTEELNGLKQAAYSFDYAHQRLVRAGGAEWPELRSLPMLLDVVVRLQIGGGRRLNAEEAELFAEAAPWFAEIRSAYETLLQDHSRLDRPSAERIRTADESLVDLLRQQAK